MFELDPGGRQKPIIAQPLREQIYEYLRDEMARGHLLPGELVNVNEISQKIGISKTPLRDALIQLECDGFVTILPRKGVMINKLSYEDVKSAWEICRVLESEAFSSVFDEIGADELKEMEAVNAAMKKASKKKDTYEYYKLNIAFHDVFLKISRNNQIRKIVSLNKFRLYDFLTRVHIVGWETENCSEHDEILRLIRKGDRQEAVAYLKETHWSFAKQEHFIRQFYLAEER